MKTAYIYDAIRTPRGIAKESGSLHDLTPLDLLAPLYKALEQRTGLNPKNVDDAILGCVTQHGEQAGNIAKTSVMNAGWPASIPGITVNRYCSSGMDAIQLAAMKIISGVDDLVIAGGIEMMSRVPMMSDNPAPFTDIPLATKIGMMPMGIGADLIASQYAVSRQQADEIALASQKKAIQAQEEGRFSSIIPIHNPVKDITLEHDEVTRADSSMETLSALKPSFQKMGAMGLDDVLKKAYKLDAINHVHTPGSSPAMADGAALLLIGSEEAGRLLNQQPRAKITALTNINDDQNTVVSGCVAVTKKLLNKQGLSVSDIDLFEIHEAFAATMVKCQKDLEIPANKLNVNGGCIALGHPLGATGGILAGTLLDELERQNLRYGIAASSGAAGAGSAILIERLSFEEKSDNK
ncbi:acetyl-CoA C-acyltransferase [Sansalvadorimonas sp. 2012CJ34-2]|uniref:Acetyl-CoA C-acyltransferase n=1 Tax=Parendozoicomonas callyspongiae TaxID=2942213 RepID=A0ABT0PKJ6_9GAMM|nr:acetyl-CoA C-acyltransferase [Sansalvadorimonas sp. 2012CJ34-2]MCL6271917.1 acetyl-CoA C-acyltransferase [Sansalvadorimonas sp. 2012CJ34-2]